MGSVESKVCWVSDQLAIQTDSAFHFCKCNGDTLRLFDSYPALGRSSGRLVQGTVKPWHGSVNTSSFEHSKMSQLTLRRALSLKVSLKESLKKSKLEETF